MTARITLCMLLSSVVVAGCGTDRPAEAPATTASAGRLNPEQVPGDLRHLVPLAERWGIGDDVERNAKVDRATNAEREELRNALQPVQGRITAWLDSFGQGAMTDEAAAFMYMQLALEEMTAGSSQSRLPTPDRTPITHALRWRCSLMSQQVLVAHRHAGALVGQTPTHFEGSTRSPTILDVLTFRSRCLQRRSGS